MILNTYVNSRLEDGATEYPPLDAYIEVNWFFPGIATRTQDDGSIITVREIHPAKRKAIVENVGTKWGGTQIIITFDAGEFYPKEQAEFICASPAEFPSWKLVSSDNKSSGG